MGTFNDFNNLHISIKSILISVISIIPFYFVSIYLFDYDILKSFNNKQFFINDFKVIFIFCLCFALSLVWVINNVFLSVGISIIGDKLTNSKPDINMPFVLTFFYSICYLSVAITLNFYFTKFTLLNFVLLSHSFLFMRFLWSFLWYLRIRYSGKLKK
jgi:hypothetical protein